MNLEVEGHRLVWARMPLTYHRELAAAGHTRILWPRGTLVKKATTPTLHAEQTIAKNVPYVTAAIGGQGMAVMDNTHTLMNPAQVWPVWDYTQHDWVYLEWLLSDNRAQTLNRLSLNARAAPDATPLADQEHMVGVIRLPKADSRQGSAALKRIAEMESELPGDVHLYGFWGARIIIASGIRSFDFDFSDAARGKRMFLPNGKSILAEERHQYGRWMEMLGFSPHDIKSHSDLCRFNIAAIRWAVRNWDEENASLIASDTGLTLDQTGDLLRSVRPVKFKQRYRKRKAYGPSPLDELLCEGCSYRDSCMSYQEGSVCVVDLSEGKKLKECFGTRDSDEIIAGLQVLMANSVDRLVEAEEDIPVTGLDQKVTSLVSNLFRQAVTLAKLVDPALRTAGVNVNVNTNGGAASITGGPEGATMVAQASQVVGILEASGIHRREITDAMVARCLNAGTEADLLATVKEISMQHARGLPISTTQASGSIPI